VNEEEPERDEEDACFERHGEAADGAAVLAPPFGFGNKIDLYYLKRTSTLQEHRHRHRHGHGHRHRHRHRRRHRHSSPVASTGQACYVMIWRGKNGTDI